jgi:hypothetical protein
MSKVKNHEGPEVVQVEGKRESEGVRELLVLGGEGAGKSLLSRRLHGE